jgi:aryl-alcohol dehydrogenase-like predicted oxidoreductase
MSLTNFRTLGRSGLVVSPLCLGTMTFGTQGWGSPDGVSEAIFNAYVDAGGNFVDTADVYAHGRSEELIGGYIADRKLRDQIVLATKFTWPGAKAGNVNAGGNGRKNMYAALEGSLKRLRTDYIDLYWMHAWDRVTPVEEIMQSLGDMLRAGKIRYFGFSDVPAWYATKAATLARAHAIPGPIALQLEYSLIERSIEREHVPAARECGLGITPWSPIAGGFLAGSYQRESNGDGVVGSGRLNQWKGFKTITERHWRALDALRMVARQLERPLAQAALAWAAAQPGVTAPIIGASKLTHLHDNLASLDIRFTQEQLQALDAASALESAHPYNIFTDEINRMAFGGATVRGWQ